MIQSVSFTSAAFEAFAEAYLCFLVSTTAKKKKKEYRGNEILKNLKKNTSPRIKYIFIWKRKAMFLLMEKSLLSFTQISNLIP